MEKPFTSAGVLPYFYSPNGNVIVILSQERRGKDIGTYADFGGGAEGAETPQESALTELYEESKGTIVASTLQYVGQHEGYTLFMSQVPYKDYPTLFKNTKMEGFKYNEKQDIVYAKLGQLLSGKTAIYTVDGKLIVLRPILFLCIENALLNNPQYLPRPLAKGQVPIKQSNTATPTQRAESKAINWGI